MKSKKNSLPKSFKPILWSYDLVKMDPAKTAKTIVSQVINYGDLNQLKWLKKQYGTNKIEQILKQIPSSQLRFSARKLAALLFKIKIPSHVSRSPKR